MGVILLLLLFFEILIIVGIGLVLDRLDKIVEIIWEVSNANRR